MSFPLLRAEFRPFLTNWPGLDFSVPPSQIVRPMIASMPPPPLPDATKVRVHNEVVPAEFEGGEAKLRLLVVGPAQGTVKGTVLVFHGGGFMIGAPEMDLPLLSYFATQGYNCLSVDYRLAPESPYPAAYDDAHRAWKYITSPAGSFKLHVDKGRVAIYGSSAGAALATGLAIRLKDEEDNPRVVVCDSMLADDRDIHPSLREGHPNEKYFVWTRANCQQASGWVFGGKDAPIEAAPLRSTSSSDFTGLAPHYISSCALDSLADQGPLYAAKLKEAGVQVELHVWPGAFHAFSSFQPESHLAQTAYEEFGRVLEEAFEDEE